jgi:glycosyltransferase involved in cell wall biosynthesis
LLVGHAFVHPRHAAVGVALGGLGFEVRVLAPERWAGIQGAIDAEERGAAGYERRFLAVRGGMSFDDTWLSGLRSEALDFKPDAIAVHAEVHSRLCFEAVRVARSVGAISLAWTHDPLEGEARAPFALYETFVREHLTAVVCSGSRGVLGRTIARGFAADRCHRIPPTGVRLQLFRPRIGGRGPNAAARVLIVGHQVRERGTPEVVAALDTLLAEGRELVAVFAGRGPERGVVEGLAGRYPARVEVTEPPASYAAVADLLRTGDIAVRHAVALDGRTEPRPQPALEAAAAGCALVATPVGGLDEVFKDGRSALLVTPGDVRGLCSAIRALVANARARAALAQAGRLAVASTHAVELVARRQAALIERLFTDRGERPEPGGEALPPPATDEAAGAA